MTNMDIEYWISQAEIGKAKINTTAWRLAVVLQHKLLRYCIGKY